MVRVPLHFQGGFPGGSDCKKKNLSAMQKTRVQSPGESHGQKSLVGYSPWGHKEPDRTERLTLSHLQEPRSFLSSCFAVLCLIQCSGHHICILSQRKEEMLKKSMYLYDPFKDFSEKSHHRLIYVLSSYVEALTPASQNVTLFGNRVFADMLVKRKSLWQS